MTQGENKYVNDPWKRCKACNFTRGIIPSLKAGYCTRFTGFCQILLNLSSISTASAPTKERYSLEKRIEREFAFSHLASACRSSSCFWANRRCHLPRGNPFVRSPVLFATVQWTKGNATWTAPKATATIKHNNGTSESVQEDAEDQDML